MLSVASKNLAQKEPVTVEPVAIVTPATPEDHWRQSGHLEVTVTARPLNPRLLLITKEDGEKCRVPVKPDLQPRFGVGKRIWVKPTPKPGFYELVGTYTQWGKRVA
jgi:hypothetical protein